MLSLMTFGVGFLMRPLGAIVLGAYIDQHGRRKGLHPDARHDVDRHAVDRASCRATRRSGCSRRSSCVMGRLLQGFSAGVELGGVSVYLSEIATPGHKGFYVSWQSGSQQVAVIFVGAARRAAQRPAHARARWRDWGWRIPFLVGCMIIPFLFVLRRSLQETDEFLAQPHHPTRPREILHSMAANWRIVIARHADGDDDDGVVLLDHRLHADLRQARC